MKKFKTCIVLKSITGVFWCCITVSSVLKPVTHDGSVVVVGVCVFSPEKAALVQLLNQRVSLLRSAVACRGT